MLWPLDGCHGILRKFPRMHQLLRVLSLPGGEVINNQESFPNMAEEVAAPLRDLMRPYSRPNPILASLRWHKALSNYVTIITPWACEVHAPRLLYSTSYIRDREPIAVTVAKGTFASSRQ